VRSLGVRRRAFRGVTRGAEPLASAGTALDDAPVITAVEALGADERGVLLGLLCAGVDGSAVARLAGAGVDRCRAAFEAWAALPEGDREAERAALVGWLAASPPPGLERVHPGWIRRALENEASRLVRAVAGGLPVEAARVADELLRARGDEPDPRGPVPEGPGLRGALRALFGALAPMPPADGGSPRARALCALGGATLLDEIDRRGAETVRRALAGAPDAVVARAAAGVGDPLARVVMASARGGEGADARATASSRPRRGRWPAIDVLPSLSRLMTAVAAAPHRAASARLREWLAGHSRNRDLIAPGAYQPGADAATDAALARWGALTAFLRQGTDEAAPWRLIELARD
jgi:hypothetical protein